MTSEAARHADFQSLRYAQCWEDADILMQGLDVRPGQICVSIASAGENSLSLLTRSPSRVVAVDLNPAQLAALELRVAAYRELRHSELLELIGSRESRRRAALYARCRTALSAEARSYWDARGDAVEYGIGASGKFERYLSIFRRFVLPLVHRHRRVEQLLVHRESAEQRAWYEKEWDTAAWRALFRVFFSERVLGAFGRDPSFFRYAEGSVADHLLARVRHALAELNPSANPYATWILTGTHREALPHALRAEHFDTIRANLDRLEWHRTSVESLLDEGIVASFDRANLSDIFEYMSAENASALFGRLADAGRPEARLAYWNMMVPRRASELVPGRFRRLDDLSRRLFLEDKAFFYRDFVVEEVVSPA